MKLPRYSIGIFILAFVAACASTEVTERQAYEGEKLAKPERIIVHNFTADPAKVPAQSSFAADKALSTTPMTPEQLKETKELGSVVAKELVEKLKEAGLRRYARPASQPPRSMTL